MKTKLLLIAAITVITLTPSLLIAQEKGAARLMKLNPAPAPQQTVPTDIKPMSCAKCQDSYTTVTNRTAKGANPEEVKTVVKHQCPTCSTFIKTEGAGKNAKNVLAHTCNSCGSTDVACCATKESTRSTTGM
jgi:hypothetical protein